MNSTKLPFKKRTDPLDNVNQPEQTPTFRSNNSNVTKRSGKKNNLVEKNENDREKYTATMDKELRKRVKLASIKEGMLVSAFIEQACIEKLDREGY